MQRVAERLVLAALAAVALLAAAPVARAQRSCEEAVAAWTARCSEAGAIAVRASHCPGGAVVVGLSVPGYDLLHVEIARAGARSFRRAGALGLSPVGEFADWTAQPEPIRRAFDVLVECARRDPALPVGDAPARSVLPLRSAPRVPWPLLVGLAIALAACTVPRLRGRRVAASRRGSALHGIALLGLLWAATIAVRSLVPGAFFHQNGQGPLWIAHAIAPSPGMSDYGPGYGELFGWLATLSTNDPDGVVFIAQRLLGALVGPLAWIVARRAGSGPVLAASLAALVALDPLLARIAASESYFAVGVLLAFGASALLADGARAGRASSPAFLARVAAAGLLVAQSARTHPLLWLGCACLPLVCLALPGPAARRVRQTLVAAGGIALVVAAAAGSSMLAVLRGPLGAHAQHRVFEPFAPVPLLIGATALVLFALPLRWPSPVQRPLLVVATTLWIASSTQLLSAAAVWFEQALARQVLPTVLAGAAGVVAAATRRWPPQARPRAMRVAAAVVLLVGTPALVLQWPLALRLTADARETTWARTFRGKLPPDARVVYVSRAGTRVLELPVYDDPRRHLTRAIRVRAEDVLPDLGRLPGDVYYYRSSLCSTMEGRAACAALEKGEPLREVAHLDLDPVASYQPLGPDPIRVVLYRLEGR